MAPESRKYLVGNQLLTLEQLRLAADVYLGLVEEGSEAAAEIKGFLGYLADKETEAGDQT